MTNTTRTRCHSRVSAARTSPTIAAQYPAPRNAAVIGALIVHANDVSASRANAKRISPEPKATTTSSHRIARAAG